MIKSDVILIGGGIMSATLAAMIRELEPSWSILILERLEEVAQESSAAWNNAGTGHQALCELNYTPWQGGKVDIGKAVGINEAFELSKQFWAYGVQNSLLQAPSSFINPIPHMSFVRGEALAYLRARYEALSAHPLFRGMEYSEDSSQITRWSPLLMQGRDLKERVAATYNEAGSDVDFGAITKQLCRSLGERGNVALELGCEAVDVKRQGSGAWRVRAIQRSTGQARDLEARFLFIGAGGATLPLLAKSQIPEARGYGGFPVSGRWLVCEREEVIKQHRAKVYGRAACGAPPMSVPHLDTRVIEGRSQLLFGPFAGFSPKFLKQGSRLDFLRSINGGNLKPLLQAGADNLPLTRYLLEQIRLDEEGRMASLREYLPSARAEDWELRIAGQRVQVIKPDPASGRGVLQFGTEVVASRDGTLAALLGASPGASTAVSVMLEVLERAFAREFASPKWQGKLKAMLPSWRLGGGSGALWLENRQRTAEILKIPC